MPTLSLRLRGVRDTEQFQPALEQSYARLFQATRSLDALAEQLGVTSLGASYSADTEAGAAALAEATGRSDARSASWHRTDDGLRTITALTGNLELIDRPATGISALLAELNLLWELFTRLAGSGATFHFHVEA